MLTPPYLYVETESYATIYVQGEIGYTGRTGKGRNPSPALMDSGLVIFP